MRTLSIGHDDRTHCQLDTVEKRHIVVALKAREGIDLALGRKSIIYVEPYNDGSSFVLKAAD